MFENDVVLVVAGAESVACEAMQQTWQGGPALLEPRTWRCWGCSTTVSESYGFKAVKKPYVVHACPNCQRATFFELGVVASSGRTHAPPSPVVSQMPQCPPGSEVASLPTDVAALYMEARQAAGAQAPTASVMLCRVLLQHVAVDKGAKPKSTFKECVQHLLGGHWLPPTAAHWLDQLREAGNEANHDLIVMKFAEAEHCIYLMEVLLKNVYEMPGKMRP